MVAAKRLNGPRKALIFAATAATLIFTLFPFYWMATASIKIDEDLYNTHANPFAIVHVTLSHFIFLFTQTNFLRWMLNSAIVATTSTVLSTFCAIFAGYSLSRLRYRGAGAIGWGVFVTYLIPQTLLFIPLTLVMSKLHLLNSLWGLILVYPTFLIPFSTWMMMGYFKGIPKELEESGLVDGCTRLQAMFKLILPLALPGILSAAIFAFTLSWNEYIYALVFINDSALKTIPIGVPSELVRGDVFYWGELMAGALLGSVPVAILYSFFVDHFVSGLTAGAVKG
ncbi:MAG: carbohydrate ABC transporter permease [Candidatus Velthaea sp.]